MKDTRCKMQDARLETQAKKGLILAPSVRVYIHATECNTRKHTSTRYAYARTSQAIPHPSHVTPGSPCNIITY
jgi:hypothetical protein